MQDPIWEVMRFRGLPHSWLARRTDYSVQYIRDLASGRKPVTAVFRKRASFALDLPEEMLFSDCSLADCSSA